jgi:hypothetical protein
MFCHPEDASIGSNATIEANKDDDVDESFLMQPPSLVNTIHSPFYADDYKQAPTFLDSVCRTLDFTTELHAPIHSFPTYCHSGLYILHTQL